MTERVCVITGTSAGIGQAVTEAVLQRGWRVIGIARRQATFSHAGYTHHRVDMSDLPALESWCAETLAPALAAARPTRLGLVNNAGLLAPVGPIQSLGMAELQRAYAVNTIAPVWLSGFMMRCAGSMPLRIVNVSSGAAHNPMPGWGAYCGTKAALLMAGQVLGEEVAAFAAGGQAPPDVALVSYAPGTVDTGMQAQLRAYGAAEFPAVERFQALQRDGNLLPPERPAAEIADLLEADDLPPASVRRIQP